MTNSVLNTRVVSEMSKVTMNGLLIGTLGEITSPCQLLSVKFWVTFHDLTYFSNEPLNLVLYHSSCRIVFVNLNILAEMNVWRV